MVKIHIKTMLGPGWSRILPALAVPALLTAVFFCRAPVVLVTDDAFTLLYGEKRALTARLMLSLTLFRPIKTLAVAPGAGPDLVARSAAGLSSRPRGVFFPYRYREGARRYLKNRPGFPVAVLAGRQEPEISGSGEEPLWIRTDTRTDLYRAGAMAGMLTGKDGGFAVLYHRPPEDGDTRAFTRGFTGQGRPAGALFFVPEAGFSGDPPPWGIVEPGCVVAVEGAGPYLAEGRVPLVLFTWLDPALIPAHGAVVFDDSPWAQLAPALKLLNAEAKTGSVPSRIVLLDGLRAMKREYLAIHKLKTVKYNLESADN
ncbi:MAG: hypothetical protein LBP60_00820 [Spirochaetaceae bacterium]|jgi:hypothetical protein|nr:hypothetical protein [Spirochaetaceae bacterium]